MKYDECFLGAMMGKHLELAQAKKEGNRRKRVITPWNLGQSKYKVDMPRVERDVVINRNPDNN